MEKITSTQNPKIKNIIKLREARERKKQNLIIIEGQREIDLAIKGGIEIESLFYCDGFKNNCHFDPEHSGEKSLRGECLIFKGFLTNVRNDKIVNLDKKVFEKISYRENPDGFLALAKPKKINLAGLKLSTSPLILILDKIEKPGNLGAILRTADAAGVDAVILSDSKIDLYNPNAIRASQGTIFTKQIISAKSEELIKYLKNKKIKIFSAYLHSAKNYLEIDYKKPCALIMGAEDQGLGDNWLKASDEKIKIAMHGKIDSLNVSVSAAVIIFEAVRQRKK